MTEPDKRFAFVDAFRAIGAFLIASFHFYMGSLVAGLHFEYPFIVHKIFSQSCVGVIIFFFLSGFVIAFRLNPDRFTSRFFCLFYLRRFVRLSLPYWAAIGVILILRMVTGRMVSLDNLPFPAIGVILKNVFYLQIFFNVETIVPGAWTLIVELQLYMVMLILFAVAKFFIQHTRLRFATIVLIVFSHITVLSLLDIAGLKLLDLGSVCGSFLPYWYTFFAGAMIWWVIIGKLPKYFFVGFFVLASSLLIKRWELQLYTTLVLSSLFYIWGVFMEKREVLTNRPLQYFGKISYSFYLLHMITMMAVFRIVGKMWGGLQAYFLLWFIFTLILCTLVARLFYRVIEQPSTKLSRQIRM
jgi:peptidoglycan/LPS O-acetylase OafA/YrhL